MSNFDTVVLDGEMGLFTKVREGDLPYYTGATEVTPSNETQTLPTADTIVTSNITINPIPEMDLEEVEVTYTPDEEGLTDTITPSTGYVGISEVEVTVEPIDPEYVGSDIARNDSDDLTASGATVTAPAGYYENAATKTIASGSAATPATSITANPSISVGNDGSITASVSATQSVTPTVEAGYVSSGTAGTITVSGSGSSQLSTQAGATITPSTSQQTAVAAGKFTTGAVTVDPIPSEYIIPTGTKTIDENGTGIDVSAFAAVDVAVPDAPTLQTKSVSYTPSETAQSESVTPSAGYDGLDKVNVSVAAIPGDYVGSSVTRRSSTDLSASGATITAPAGYYESAASKAVASGSASTPATSITANPSISVNASGLITATASASQSVTPTVSAGYVASGTAGTVSVSGSATQQLSTQSATTITPTTSSQTAVSAGKYTTGAVTVDPIPSQYIVPTGTKSITENGTGIDVAAYAAVDVNVSGGGGGSSDDDWMNKTVTSITTSQTEYKTVLDGFSELVTFSAPNLINLYNANYFFRNCIKLTSVSLPSVQRMYGASMFENTKITTLVLPNIGDGLNNARTQAYIGGNCYKGCTNLQALDYARINRIDNNCFENDTSFDTFIIRGRSGVSLDQLPQLQNINSFTNTPFASGGTGGTLYVPEAYIADYQSATNWSVILGYANNQIKKIEGSYYETHYADGTTIPTT